MKVVVVGCGGIGGVLAATLTRAGVDTTPVAGNANIAGALESRGFTVRELDGSEWSVAAQSPRVALAAGDGPFDLAILATQNTTLERAIRDTLPFLRPEAPIVTIQNGLPEERARAFRDADHVLVVDIFASRETDTLGVSSQDVVNRMLHPDARYVGSLEAATAIIAEEAQPGDVVLTLGAGDVWKVAESLVK